MKMTSVRKKITWTVLPVTLVIFVVSSFLLVYTAMKDIYSKAEAMAVSQTESCAQGVEDALKAILADAEILHENLEFLNPEGAELDRYLEYTMSVNPAFPYGIYMGNKKNEYYDPSWEPDAGYVAYERQWYHDGIDKGKMTFGEAYVDSQTGELCLSASCKYSAKPNDMVMATDVFLADISQTVAEKKVLDNGYCYLMDVSGTILAHTNADYLGKNYTELPGTPEEAAASFLGREVGSIHAVKVAMGSYYICMEDLPSMGWTMISVVPQSDITKSVIGMLVIAVTCMLVAAILLIIILQIIVANIVKPIKALTKDIDEMTDGNFSINVQAHGNDEIGQIGFKLKEFVERMGEMFSQITDLSKDLYSQAESSSNTAENLASAAQKQSDSMTELNSTVEQLSYAIDEVANNATELVQVVERTAERGSYVNGRMQDTTESASRGKNGMEKVSVSVESTEKQMESLREAVLKVGGATDEIGKFVSTIGDIASQTNLLSLNASIEAARAGEAGRGFAVVADEIRKLADTSAESVAEITQITDKISLLIKDVVDETNVSVEQMRNCNELVDGVVSDFDIIYGNVQEASNAVNEIVTEVDKISDMATNMAAIAEEQAASAQEIASTAESTTGLAEEVSNNSTEVSGAAESISKTSRVLTDNMKAFKL